MAKKDVEKSKKTETAAPSKTKAETKKVPSKSAAARKATSAPKSAKSSSTKAAESAESTSTKSADKPSSKAKSAPKATAKTKPAKEKPAAKAEKAAAAPAKETKAETSKKVKASEAKKAPAKKEQAPKAAKAEAEPAKKAAPKKAVSKKETSAKTEAKKPAKTAKKGEPKTDKKLIKVADLNGLEIPDLDRIKAEMAALAEKKGNITLADLDKATSHLEIDPDDLLPLVAQLQDEGILVLDEDGNPIEMEGDIADEDDLPDADNLEDEAELLDDEELDADADAEVKVDKEDVEKVEDDIIDVPVQADIKVSDPVKLYLKNIGHFPVLKSKEDETELAKKIIEGEEARKELEALMESAENSGTPVDNRAVASLRFTIQDGDEAKDTLTNCNLKLVVSIAKHYVNRGMQFLDLIQEGNIGLMKAVEKFDYTRGFKFSTYATWWIRQAITRALADQARTIRIPVHMVETINKISRAQRKLVQTLNRDPSPEEIAADLNYAMTADRIREVQQFALDPISLEKPVGEEEDSHVGDFIEDKENESPSDYAEHSMLKERLNEVLNDLSERERAVIQLRYGLIDGHTETLEEVGRRFAVTRERIRQIEAKAIKKLRQPKRANMLRDFRLNPEDDDRKDGGHKND